MVKKPFYANFVSQNVYLFQYVPSGPELFFRNVGNSGGSWSLRVRVGVLPTELTLLLAGENLCEFGNNIGAI